MKKVIVYGTLKKHGRLSTCLRDAKYVKDVIVTGFKMYDTKNGFPFIEVSDKKDTISGELYEVDYKILNTLDYIEGVESTQEKGHRGLFSRIDLKGIRPEIKESTYIYVSTIERMRWFGVEPEEIKDGFWKTN